MTAQGLPDGARLEILRGNPSAEDVAAVLLALDQAAAADAAAASGHERSPAWLRAARLEGLGHRLVVAPRDLVEEHQ